MTDQRDSLNILAHVQAKPRLDALHRNVERAAGRRLNRRDALSLAGLALLTAACGGTTTSNGGNSGGAGSKTSGGSSLAGKPVENHLEIYNWESYDDPKTYKSFLKQPDLAQAGTKIHESYFASNDELLAKLHAGGSSYDIIVPSQNAVGQLIEEGQLMKLDQSLLPNLKNVDPRFLKPSYDPTGEYHIIKDYGITMFFYNNKIVNEKPKTLHDFYELLPKYHSQGRTNLLEGAEEVVPLALMALGLDPNTDSDADFQKVRDYLMSIRKGVTTISSSASDDEAAGKILLGQDWNGSLINVLAQRKEGDLTGVIPEQASEIWADNWCIPASAPHPVAAHAWIDYLMRPEIAVQEMVYNAYPIPIDAAVAKLPKNLSDNPMFNVPAKYTDNYKYILNPTPEIVQQRTEIYTEFKAA
jgi:spermidine/putrescine transport system substrate-binding protein